MNVPLFPAPPVRDITIPVQRDILSTVTSREPLPREFALRRRHVLLERTRPVSANCARKKRKHLRKDLVHPRQGSKKSGKSLRRRVTEFCLTMTEQREKEEDEDDANTVFAAS
ncbi:uncharacterized protein LOC117169660 [Belonocnema kinseyi]|uniref:uncharacterized protein LOC117169660 n=1 Tax=Belonocnema kinseyi TaxID=2817044 RepID=UPI00143CD570|nr:uncharacterized protein LOC117169660 [Belonocnema kinseyi]